MRVLSVPTKRYPAEVVHTYALIEIETNDIVQIYKLDNREKE